MNTRTLEKFAQSARRDLHAQIAAKLTRVLTTDSAELRARASTVADLRQQVKAYGKPAVVERVAYTWFNRFCALRFMDANRYTRMGIVSPAPGNTQPEILQEAKQGHIDPELPMSEADRQRVADLLTGRLPSPDPQQEAYRLLLVAACNFYHGPMPFLFETIADYTELLMPDDLLSQSSILHGVRAALDDDACQDVEVIGWLYQFYISEKKDKVIGSKAKIAAADIPAATQLFTPHWIVRYLVENSLGRLWMRTHPRSRLADRMDYYIGDQGSGNGDQGSDQSPNFPISQSRVPVPQSPIPGPRSPESIRLCDPAAGSGHMLTYAFDLLYAIYEEEGYPPSEIPRLILTQNLVGLEIDERAGALAAFALTMKAQAKDRRFLRRGVRPQIVVLRPMTVDPKALAQTPWMQALNRELLGQPVADALTHDLGQLPLLDTVGSLLRPRLTVAQIQELRTRIDAATDLFSQAVNDQVLAALDPLEALARPYDVVVANPPYMGGGGMNDDMKAFLKDNYADVKSDLFSAFMVRNTELARHGGQLGFMTPFVWMFISSYEKLRTFLIDHKTITSLVQLEYSGFDGATVPICTFTLENKHDPDFKGGYVRLSDFRGSENQGPKTLEAIQDPDCGWFYRAAAVDFKKIPGSPIAYWVSGIHLFEQSKFNDFFVSGGRTKTHNNEKYLRYFWEIECNSLISNWKFIANGGNFRKFYGNEIDVIQWTSAARDFYSSHGGLANEKYSNKEGITWTMITSATPGFRIKMAQSEYSSASPTIFNDDFSCDKTALAFLNSPISKYFLQALNPTLNTTVGDILALPFLKAEIEEPVNENAEKCIAYTRADWDSYETSWDFTDLPLLRAEFRGETLAATYAALRGHWQAVTTEMQRLEEENNRLFIAAYGLQDELTPDVPLAEITLTCNPHYRYNAAKPQAELDALLLADTLREFISYAVGCMFGRYSLDKPGLILANQGEGVADYVRLVGGGVDGGGGGNGDGNGDRHRLKPTPDRGNLLKQVGADGDLDSSNLLQQVSPGSNRFESVGPTDPQSRPTFPPDRDNVIPMLDGDWFEDDMADRFKRFLRVTFGDAHYSENLRFIEDALGRDLRNYFLREFYDDHVKRYSKRPIYWLFSSPKGSFNALIYMHRYRPDTLSIVLNDYLREFRAKLTARKQHLEGVSISPGASPRDKTQALKEIDQITKTLAELVAYEDEVLYPLATQQVKIDLDDGVKVNYGRFAGAVKGIKGLS